MAKTDMITGQYVRISQTPASVGERMLAQAIDWAIQGAYFALWIRLAPSLDALPALFLIVLPVLLYCPLCEFLSGGQTIGKWLVSLRVIMADGLTTGCMGVLVMILNRNNQRLGDMAAGTLVVKLRSYSKIQVSLDEYDYLSENYRPSYPQASDLSLEQVDVVTRTLDSHVPERIALLSQKVQQLFGITRRETTDEQFLLRIVRDYQYYALEEV